MLEVSDEIAQGFKVDNVALKSGQRASLEAAVEVGIKRVLASLESGPLRDHCIKFSKQISRQKDILVKPPDSLVGKVFQLPGTEGTRVLFKSFAEFKQEFLNTYALLGLRNSEDDFMRFYTNIAEGTIEPVQEESIDLLASLIVQELKKTKMTLVPDLGVGKKGVFYFYLDLGNNSTQIQISASEFSEALDIQETLEHEMIHAVDRMILTVIAGGDKLSEAVIKKLNLRLSSEMTLGSGSYVFAEKAITKIIDTQSLGEFKPWQRYMYIMLANEEKNSKKTIAEKLAYVSDPGEFFVRAQRISGWLVRRGRDPRDWSSFFNQDFKQVVLNMPDSDLFEVFFKLFQEEASGTLSPFQAECLKSFKQTLDAAL